MPDEPQVPAQPEGAGSSKKKSPPVNLALVEAAERGIDLHTPPPERAKTAEPRTETPEPEPSQEPIRTQSAEKPTRESPGPPQTPLETASDVGGEQLPAADQLKAIADSANEKRLSPREEDTATGLLRACLASGDSGPALSAMPRLPWILGVRAIEQAWTELTPETRNDLLNRLAALDSDHAIRLRLSVARSLAKLEPPVGVQLAGAVCRTMWNAEKGTLSSEHSKLIGNVFIGRGKPWVLQLPLNALEPQDADAIASCVVFSAFNVNNPPITQLSVLRYAAPRLSNLHPNLLTMVAKSVSRWSTKWQESLRKEVPELPDQIASALKSGRSGKPDRQAESAAVPTPRSPGGSESDEEAEVPLPPELEEKLKLAIESGDTEAVEAANLEVNAWRDAQASTRSSAEPTEAEGELAEETSPESRSDKRGRRGRDRGERPERPDRSERKERPPYVSREQEAAAKTQGGFNLSVTLKSIENHVAQLRNELGNAQAKLRKAESSGRRPSDKVLLSVEEANLSSEELKRLVLQLEHRNNELQARVEELLADSETRALATASDTDVTAQYRTLLKLKLQEDYSDYRALESNSPEFVVQQHYRALIRHVFSILRDEGISLEGDLPPPPPDPLPPPPPPPVIEDDEEEEESPLDKLDEDTEPDAEQAEAEAIEDPSEPNANIDEIGQQPVDEAADSNAEEQTDRDR